MDERAGALREPCSRAAELTLHGFHKIPFTCSYLPGKSHFHMALLAFLGLVFLIAKGAGLERSALDDPILFAKLISVLAMAAAIVRWRTSRANAAAPALQFEEELPPVIVSLDLEGRRTSP